MQNLTAVQAIVMKDIHRFKKRGLDYVFRLTQLVSLELWGCLDIESSIFPSFTALTRLRHLVCFPFFIERASHTFYVETRNMQVAGFYFVCWVSL
jgi:hypothetical protein